MATNWDSILSSTNNLNDVLAILQKVLAQLATTADPNYAGKSFVTNDYSTLAQANANDGQIAFVKADGIAGEFRYDASSTAAENGGTIIASVNGGRWLRKFSGKVYSNWFTSLQTFVDYCITNKLNGHFVGVSIVTSTLNFDFNLNREGFKFTGDGIRSSIIKRNDNGEVVRFYNSNSVDKDSFYGVFRDIGIEGINDSGAVFNIGSPDHSDALNDCDIKIITNNSSQSANAISCQVNHVCNSRLFIISNISGFDKGLASLKVTQMQFCELFGSFSNSKIGLYITDGYTYGNTIISPDLEAVGTCLKIDSATVTNNTVIGGQFDWWGVDGCGVDATSGSNNKLLGGNFSGGSMGALASRSVLNSIGIVSVGDGTSYGTAYQGNTRFRNSDTSDTFIYLDSATGVAGVIFEDNGLEKFRIDQSGGNLVFRYNDGSTWVDAGYLNGSGVFNINSLNATKIGVDTTPISKQTISGSKGGNAALGSLILALSKIGLIVDSTS